MAVCEPGFERLLADELTELFPEGEFPITTGGVSFSAPLPSMAKVNLKSRIAVRLLLRIAQCKVHSYPELFDRAKRLPWELYLGLKPACRLKISATSSRLHHTDNIAHTLKAAIAARLGSCGEGEIEIVGRVFQDTLTLSLNTSGAPLYQRGYRVLQATAPLRETTAAALLRLAGAPKIPVIFDPCCGSGTFLLEAADLVTGWPGRFRDFAYQKMSFYRNYYDKGGDVPTPHKLQLYGSDISAEVIATAAENFRRLQPAKHCTWQLQESDARKIHPPTKEAGLVISNLPYGKRLKAQEAFYRSLAQQLSLFHNWKILLLVPKAKVKWFPTLKTLLEFDNGGIRVVALGQGLPHLADRHYNNNSAP